MNKLTTLEKYFSPIEAAEVLGLNEQTVRRYLRRGQLRGVKMRTTGARKNAPWRIPQSALAEFMEGAAA